MSLEEIYDDPSSIKGSSTLARLGVIQVRGRALSDVSLVPGEMMNKYTHWPLMPNGSVNNERD